MRPKEYDIIYGCDELGYYAEAYDGDANRIAFVNRQPDVRTALEKLIDAIEKALAHHVVHEGGDKARQNGPCKYYRKLDILLALHDRAEEALGKEKQA